MTDGRQYQAGERCLGCLGKSVHHTCGKEPDAPHTPQAHGDALAKALENLDYLVHRNQLDQRSRNTIRRHLTASGVPESVRRLPEHFRTVSVFSHQTEESTLAWKEAANQLERALASAPAVSYYDYERDLHDDVGKDRSQDTDWLRAGFLQRGAEIERLEDGIRALAESLDNDGLRLPVGGATYRQGVDNGYNLASQHAARKIYALLGDDQ